MNIRKSMLRSRSYVYQLKFSLQVQHHKFTLSGFVAVCPNIKHVKSPQFTYRFQSPNKSLQTDRLRQATKKKVKPRNLLPEQVNRGKPSSPRARSIYSWTNSLEFSMECEKMAASSYFWEVVFAFRWVWECCGSLWHRAAQTELQCSSLVREAQ